MSLKFWSFQILFPLLLSSLVIHSFLSLYKNLIIFLIKSLNEWNYFWLCLIFRSSSRNLSPHGQDLDGGTLTRKSVKTPVMTGPQVIQVFDELNAKTV